MSTRPAFYWALIAALTVPLVSSRCEMRGVLAEAARSDSIADAELARADDLQGRLAVAYAAHQQEALEWAAESGRLEEEARRLRAEGRRFALAAENAASALRATLTAEQAATLDELLAAHRAELDAERADHSITKRRLGVMTGFYSQSQSMLAASMRQTERVRAAERARADAGAVLRAELERQQKKTLVWQGVAAVTAACVALCPG